MMMNDENKTSQALSTMFYGSVTFNGPMFDIHDNGTVVIHGGSAPQGREERKTERVLPERLAHAVEAAQRFFWAQSAWAVVYCVCRDHLEMTMGMSEFERMVAELPFTRQPDYLCPTGTVRRAFANNDYLYAPFARWPEGRALILAQELARALGEG